MGQKINAIYQDAAREFARRVVSALRDEVDSIVLYGSTARGAAKSESDVDVLVISRDAGLTRDRLSQIRSDFTYQRNYAFFISVVHYGREEFFGLSERGSPFIDELLAEGVILNDNGTFSGIREGSARVSR